MQDLSQKILGHKTLSALQKYLEVLDEDLESAIATREQGRGSRVNPTAATDAPDVRFTGLVGHPNYVRSLIPPIMPAVRLRH